MVQVKVEFLKLQQLTLSTTASLNHVSLVKACRKCIGAVMEDKTSRQKSIMNRYVTVRLSFANNE